MHRLIVLGLLLSHSTSHALTPFPPGGKVEPGTYLHFGLQSLGKLWDELEACGLKFEPAEDHKACHPAGTAILSPKGRLMACYNEDLAFGGNVFYFRNPDGSFLHFVFI